MFDITVLKYGFFSVVVASVFLSLISHFFLDQAIHILFDFFQLDQILPEIAKFKGVAGFFLSFVLFHLAMPIIATAVIPLTIFFQICFFESFSNEYQKKNYNCVSNNRSTLVSNLFIFFKWTVLKIVIFSLMYPLFHVPLFGWVIHLFLVTLWVVIIYNEMVSRKYCKAISSYKCLINNSKNVLLESFKIMLISYFSVWFCIYVSIMIPPIKPLSLLLMAFLVIVNNYVMASKFIKSSININKSLIDTTAVS